MSDDDRIREIIQLQLGELLSKHGHEITELQRHRDTYIVPTLTMLEEAHDNRIARYKGYKWAAGTGVAVLSFLQLYGDKLKAFLFG